MKTLEERLEERRTEYEALVKAENLAESVLNKILPLFPEDTNCTGSIYSNLSYLYITVDSVEEFEEHILSKLSEILGTKWERSIGEVDIAHRTEFKADENHKVYLTVTSKPTDSCRIIAVATGKTKTVSRLVYVEEAEVEHLIDCGDPVEESPNA